MSACLQNDTDLSSSTTDNSTTGDDTTGTSTAESSSTTADTGTTTAIPCDDDPVCGPDETPETCPEQCSECGDGVVSGDEECDNGQANQDHWPAAPPDDACSDSCTRTVEWCGDGKQNADEACDNGTNQDPPYSPTLPDGACAPGCVIPGYCGDGENTGEEACDDGLQTATCELNCVKPTCGDGTQNPLAGEACDDNNKQDGDGCTAECVVERKVFVTSATYFGDLTNEQMPANGMSGLELADARCQQLAMAAGLAGTFKAWLSTTNVSPSTRFDTRFTGLYRLPSAAAPIVASGWQGLVSGTLSHAIDTNEVGAIVSGNVWTNTLPDGSKASDLDCDGCTINDDTKATYGKSTANDSTWTSIDSTQCSNSLRLYCMQDN